MKTTGRINGTSLVGGQYAIMLEVDCNPEQLNGMTGQLLDVTLEKHRKRRSLNANALLWKCIGDIAHDRRADKWDIYLLMLKRYGQYTYVCVKPKAVQMLKRQWRECEEIGSIDINGETAVQLLCYYGSSTYDTAEFSTLLDGTISEMKELGLDPPLPEEVRQSLESWEKGRKETDMDAN